jgi:hypothetical protein
MVQENMLITALLLSLVPAQSTPSPEEQNAYDEAFEKAFRSSGRASFIENCVSSAKNAAAAKIDTTSICSCAADKLLATKSIAELKNPIPVGELQSISAECIGEHPPQAAENSN